MAHERGEGGAGRRRTGGRAASAAGGGRRPPAGVRPERRKGLPPGFAEGRPLPESTRSTVRMEPREKVVGVAVAALLAVIAVLFATSHNPRPPQPDPAGPIAGLVAVGVLLVSLVLANRIVTGLLAIITAFLVQTPHVPHGLVWMRKGALVLAVGFALWLTLQQRHAQIDNRLRRVANRRQTGDGDGP